MAAGNYPKALTLILVHEGGYVNHPRDPGGATNKGVTQRVYDAYRKARGERLRSVKSIDKAEVGDIYKKQYWDAVRGDDLPGGVDYAVFDFAINSGPRRAIKYLQNAVSAVPDGVLGSKTLAAVRAADASRLINALCTARQKYLESLDTFAVFGKGWTRRVAEVEHDAKGMI